MVNAEGFEDLSYTQIYHKFGLQFNKLNQNDKQILSLIMFMEYSLQTFEKRNNFLPPRGTALQRCQPASSAASSAAFPESGPLNCLRYHASTQNCSQKTTFSTSRIRCCTYQ